MHLNQAYNTLFPDYPDAVHIKEAAAMLRINRHTVGELIKQERLFALKLGHSYIIPKSSVIEFLVMGKSLFPEELASSHSSNGQTAC